MGRFAINYLCPGLDFNHDGFIFAAVRKDLTRSLGSMQPEMVEDIRFTIDNALGLDDESWKEVCISEAMEEVIVRSTSRFLVGSPLYHNKEYLHYSLSFSKWLGGGSMLVGQYMPWMIKPFFGYLGALPVYYYKRKALNFLMPVLQERMDNIKRARSDPSFEFAEPKDLITWMTQAVLDNPETKDSSPQFLGTRLLFFVSTANYPSSTISPISPNAQTLVYVITKTDLVKQTLGAVHTTITTATNTMLDLVSSNPDAEFWNQLRGEAAAVFKTADDWIDPASLPKLQLTDSTIRESLRENPMLTKVILREVVPKDGVTLPSGHHIPKGTWMGVGTVDLHHDDRFYPKPDEYDPFRFVKKQEDVLSEPYHETLTEKASIYRKTQSLATASDVFLAFGYGKHAWCVLVADRSCSYTS